MMYKVERQKCQFRYIVKTTKYDYIFLRLKFNPDYQQVWYNKFEKDKSISFVIVRSILNMVNNQRKKGALVR